MHPTWRDLVIDRLAADVDARRRFLARCGVHGAVLALSVGGGAAGERRLPLMGGDEDWDAVGDRLYALAPELEPPELLALLTALTLAIEDLRQARPPGSGRAVVEVRALARIVLARVKRLWDDAGEPIALPLLESWLGLSKLLVPTEMPPSLAATWTDLLPVRVPAPDDVPEVQRLGDWLVLCELLGAFLPGLPAALGLGEEQVRLVDDFLARAALDPLSGVTDPLLRVLDAVSAVMPELTGRARRLARELRTDSELPTVIVAEPDEPREPADAFSVERVLADL